MQRLQDRAARLCAQHGEHSPDRPVLAAVSGGIDSTALLLVLQRLAEAGRLPGPLHVVHVDHGLREESRAVAQRVVDLCDRFDLPVHVRRLDPPPERTDADTLRQARYKVFGAVAHGLDARLLLTAHHADDNVETVLFRMLRGTGVRGLAGIPEARALGPRLIVLRPFLKTRRVTLERLLDRFDLAPCDEDPTNQDLRYSRNALRHETIPSLREKLGVGIDATLLTVARTATAAVEILESQGRRLRLERGRRVTPWRHELEFPVDEPLVAPFLETALRQIWTEIRPHGTPPPRSWLERATALAGGTFGQRVAGRGRELLVERTREGLLVLDPSRVPKAPTGSVELVPDAGRVRFGETEWRFTACHHPNPPMVPTPREAGPERALLDPRFGPQPWRLRTPRPGETVIPLGADGPLNLRGLLQRRGVPRFDRERMPVLVDRDDRVLWIPGVEITEVGRLHLDTRLTIEVQAERG